MPALKNSDDEFRLRLLLHGFGLVCQHASSAELGRLVAAEPDSVDERWDAFLAALVEHLCEQCGLDSPRWARSPKRRLARPWFAGGCFPYDADRTIRTTPAAFRARNVLLPANEPTAV
ncbi:hypothetical protein [Candidatus Poriferisodalis sp.]|uniref:hypothetical protein n=1 Tax=Candidatus Poriferisodalis sp. TaxID=3101277 RepID=UPI003B024CA1